MECPFCKEEIQEDSIKCKHCGSVLSGNSTVQNIEASTVKPKSKSVFRKIVYVIGIIMSLTAAEGLNRFGSLVAAFKGSDAGFYQAVLVVSVISAGVFLVALFISINKVIKWVMFGLLLVSSLLMLMAPAFDVNYQIMFGLVVAAIASIFIDSKKKSLNNGTASQN